MIALCRERRAARARARAPAAGGIRAAGSSRPRPSASSAAATSASRSRGCAARSARASSRTTSARTTSSIASTGVTPVSLDALLAHVRHRHASIVPLDASTRGLIDARALARMKPGAFLDQHRARRHRRRAGAEAARWSSGGSPAPRSTCSPVEPPVDSRAAALPNFIGTPHIGGGTREAVLAMGRAAIAGLEGDSRLDRPDVKSLT